MKKLLVAFAILGFAACSSGTTESQEPKVDTPAPATVTPIDTPSVSIDTNKVDTTKKP